MRFMLLAAAALLGACQTHTDESVPALLLAPDTQVRQQLTDTVSRALQSRVTLSPQALTKSPTLIIDAPDQRRLQNGGDRGNITGKPDHFTLWLDRGECVLKHKASAGQWTLDGAKCRAVETP